MSTQYKWHKRDNSCKYVRVFHMLHVLRRRLDSGHGTTQQDKPCSTVTKILVHPNRHNIRVRDGHSQLPFKDTAIGSRTLRKLRKPYAMHPEA